VPCARYFPRHSSVWSIKSYFSAICWEADRPQLEQIFSKTSIDDYIAERLRPRIFDSDLLTPSRFRAVLLSLRSSLRTLARHNPSSAKSLGRLAAILDEERDLADLLQMYRSALLQG
jgi:type III secretion protein X